MLLVIVLLIFIVLNAVQPVDRIDDVLLLLIFDASLIAVLTSLHSIVSIFRR